MVGEDGGTEEEGMDAMMLLSVAVATVVAGGMGGGRWMRDLWVGRAEGGARDMERPQQHARLLLALPACRRLCMLRVCGGWWWGGAREWLWSRTVSLSLSLSLSPSLSLCCA